MGRGVALLVGASLAVGAEALPQAFDLEKALELPMSPGAIALLVEHTGDERARQKLTEALKDVRAEIRAAAARVVHAACVEALVPNVAEALATESDRDAGMEMVRMIAGSAAGESVLLEATRRLDLARVTGLSLAARTGAKVLGDLDALRETDSRFPIKAFLRIASRDDLSALRPLVEKALEQGDIDFWEAYLEAARESQQNVDPGQLTSALARNELRSATLWHALVSEAELASQPTPDVEEAFLAELLARRSGERPKDDKAWIGRRAAGDDTPFSEILSLPSKRVLLLLTKDERRALSAQLVNDSKFLDDLYEGEKKTAPLPRALEGRTETRATLRTVSDFPNGFVAGLLETTGCNPKTWMGIENAEIQFSRSGSPVRVRFTPSAVESKECRDASRALILNSIVPVDALTAKARWDSLLVLVEPDFLSCLSEASGPPPSGREVVRVGRDVEPPEKIKDFSPVYPKSAMASRITGTVALQATITSSGCVRGISEIQSPDSRLTLASIVAVSKWRYEPTRLEGVPVPMVMTVTVGFALH